MRAILKIAVVVGIVTAAAWPLRAADWPEWRGAGRLGVWTETGIQYTSLAFGARCRE